MRVLVSDKLSESAIEVFRKNGIDVDYLPDAGKNCKKLESIISEYDGLAIRSSTRVDESLLDRAVNLKVVGRAGIGVDNVDVAAATRRGVVVMNTPFGNSVTTAEHTVCLMLACARQIAGANNSAQSGRWEKSRYMGVEVTGKTLGLIGCGNIGAIVAERAQGLKMRVIAHDPFLSKERSDRLGIENVTLNALLARSDFISLHVPLTDKTRGIINAKSIAKMKDGVRLVNCARGGLAVEADVAAAIKSGKIAGAAFDVFEVEPARSSPLFGLDNVVCTPHLGASTHEAQLNVAIQVAEQMSDYLSTGTVVNSLNLPAISAVQARELAPYSKLAEHLGAFVAQVTKEPIKELEISYEGDIAELNHSALTSAVTVGLIRSQRDDVNMVSAVAVAKECGIKITERSSVELDHYDNLMSVRVATREKSFFVSGTVFADGRPRFVEIEGVKIDADVGRYMLYTNNSDSPTFIGNLGAQCVEAAVDVNNMRLGRNKSNGNTIALLHLDEPVRANFLCSLKDRRIVEQAEYLEFNVA